MSLIRDDAPPSFRRFYDDYKDYLVTNVRVCREPIMSYITNFINLISLGKLKENLANKMYDDLYHLNMTLVLVNKIDGSTNPIRIEKNHVVKVSRLMERPSSVCLQLKEPVNLTFKQFIDNGKDFQQRTLNSNFWLYDAYDNNCQIFISSLVNGNHLDCVSCNNVNDFIKQDTEDLIIKPIYDLTKGITNVASVIDTILHGRGF